MHFELKMACAEIPVLVMHVKRITQLPHNICTDTSRTNYLPPALYNSSRLYCMWYFHTTSNSWKTIAKRYWTTILPFWDIDFDNSFNFHSPSISSSRKFCSASEKLSEVTPRIVGLNFDSTGIVSFNAEALPLQEAFLRLLKYTLQYKSCMYVKCQIS